MSGPIIREIARAVRAKDFDAAERALDRLNAHKTDVKAGRSEAELARPKDTLPPLDFDPLEEVAAYQRVNGCAPYIAPPRPA